MGRDGRRLPFRALQRGHIGRRRVLLVCRGLVVDDIELAHRTPPTISAAPWHTELAFSRPWFCGRARACPRKRHRVRTCLEAPANPRCVTDGETNGRRKKS